MCGIAGIFCYGGAPGAPDRALLERMTRALAHRGPDGEGFHVEGPVALGHRRLAIIDPTPTGAQPMGNEDGSCWITYNGEFYDHADHRARLSNRHVFRGRSDTETLLHLLEEHGVEGLERISSIFAFAFWNRRAGTLTLARDQLGVKQLYFHDDGARVLFASEIKALLCAPEISRDVDPEAVNQYLHFHTPLFERTFFKGIRQLQPGEWLEWRLRGPRRQGRYWRLRSAEPEATTERHAMEELREGLSRVVASQLLSDVPVGAFFSGGLDSSAVAAFATAAGQQPRCFGVHFSGQGVIDERPFQELAARALGLELELIALDGRSFPEDMPRLVRQQDQPVIGPALIPMFHVSRLAAGHVKVCLGGQAADEVLAGYARYSLAHPLRTAAGILSQRVQRATPEAGTRGRVGGNLWLQLRDARTLRRAVGGVGKLLDWETLYFDNFAQIPEPVWRSVVAADDLVSRESCWLTFRETVARSPFADPATRAMHWDLQTYLPGLFQQDDRMSMANGLESRVPFADPRLVELAFRIPFGMKMRSGASKWLLRKIMADVLPSEVLNRRKVGFDTPVERWMRGEHAGFVRETLLSRAARERGLWNSQEVRDWLDRPSHRYWVGVIWKLLSVELWAQQLLDRPPEHQMERSWGVETPSQPARGATPRVRLAGLIQEARELGFGGLAFRIGWETRLRSGWMERMERKPADLPRERLPARHTLATVLPFRPSEVAPYMATRLSVTDREHLASVAQEAVRGRILAFGRWYADYGSPPDWHVNPLNGRRWNPEAHWSRVMRDERRVGDIKLTWEIGRFPHAYTMSRAAVHLPQLRPALAASIASQIRSFVDANPYAHGAHWASGQEIAFRSMAWLFALGVLGDTEPMEAVAPDILRSLHLGAAHIERHLDYTLKAVYNNHLLSEALALLLAGELLPTAPEAGRWRSRGFDILTAQAPRQFYDDGGYIQLSHNYERVALQVYLWAVALLRRQGNQVPEAWLAALQRATAFLHAQQNPADGRLPNYGANDGALPSPLTSCDFSDFRPVLQAASVAANGERLYPPGPWDEEAAWLFGSAAVDVPLRSRERTSVSFATTGFHVLRGRDESSFATFRCGSVRDRFSQMDMLSLDVWWRGQNVLVDGGSYLYNGPERWHEYFTRTSSHNTVVLDGRDQMEHFRRFKNLYWTKAGSRAFQDHGEFAVTSGEHYAYDRQCGCTHRRAVLYVKDDLWIALDRLHGDGEHTARVHWLCGEFPHEYDLASGRLCLDTPSGEFSITVLDERGSPLRGSVVKARTAPPRGWLSRYYGERRPVPSLAIERRDVIPITVVSLLSGGRPTVEVSSERWSVRAQGVVVAFGVAEGEFVDVRVERTSSCSDLA